MDTLHRKLLKYILGTNKSSPNIAIYGDTGETPLTIKGFTLLVNFWHHLTELPETSLAKLALKESIEIRSNWIKTVEKIINIFNLSDSIGNPCFKYISKEIGRKLYTSKWEETITSIEYSRLKFYKTIKSEHSPAIYTQLPFYQRKVIAKMRCSSHNLEIEKGRHKKKLAEDRLCLMCTEKVIEDETHFLSFCPAYNTLRLKHGYTNKNPVDIMSDRNQTNLSIYLSKSFNLRKETIEN